jgi:tRNA(Ile)-lysidine synthase
MLDRLTVERLAARAGDTPILVALSGGGDSVALMHLLADELGRDRLRAGVVDHALRAGSADDARRALGFATALDIEARVLTLNWPEGPKRAQQATREARYRALCDHARGIGAHTICVGHTSDDQAETLMMRAAAGSSWRGLAAMAALAPAPVWPEGREIVLARPLLGVRRAALREELVRRGAPWIEDPANANEVFERVRVRARLADLEAAGFEPMRLARIAERLRARVEEVDRAAAALIAQSARFEEDRIVIACAQWQGAGEVRRRALSALVAAAAGARREAPAEAVARLESQFGEHDFRGASLGGAVLARRGQEAVLSRDAGALQGRADGASGIAPVMLAPGREVIWDGRLAVVAHAPAMIQPDGAIVAANGEPAPASRSWRLRERAAHALGVEL